MLETTGTPARRLEFPPVFRRMVTNGFLAHKATVEGNPSLVERFGRAYTAAVAACDANVRACIEAFWKRTPQARPDGDAARALVENTRIVDSYMQRLRRSPEAQARTPGAYDLEIIRDYVKVMHQYGEFPSADIPLDAYFSNRFVTGYNRFDAASIAARARALP
jgi:NitT/TauT family transport system substrate-binding protein